MATAFPPADRARALPAGVRLAVLAVLVLVAAPPRLWDLARNPPALNADELGNVAPVLAIARTGRDLDGRLFPMTYHRITRRPPLYGLLAGPLSLVFGPTPLAVRLPAAALGLAGLALLWVVGSRLLEHPWGGPAAAVVMAMTPWHVHYSRIGWEPATVIPLVLVALWLWLRAVETRLPRDAAWAGAALALTVYGYKAFDVLAPVWLAALLALYGRRLGWRPAAAAVGAFGLVLVPFAWTSLADPAMHRWAAGLFVFSKGVDAGALAAFAGRYLAHFSAAFLFLGGDPNTRHHAPGTGMLFWWMAPLVVIGVAALARRRDLRWRGLLAVWLVLYPLAGALTTDQPVHASRTLVGLPALSLCAALGALTVAGWIARQPARFLLGVAAASALAVPVAYEAARFALIAFVRYPRESWARWDYGHAEIFAALRARADRYDRACVEVVDWYHHPTYREVYLRDMPRPVSLEPSDPACTRPGTLVAAEARAVPAGVVVEVVIRSPGGEPIYVLYGRPR